MGGRRHKQLPGLPQGREKILRREKESTKLHLWRSPFGRGYGPSQDGL